MKALLVLVVLWVMTMVTLVVLDWMGLIKISGEGKIFGISSRERVLRSSSFSSWHYWFSSWARSSSHASQRRRSSTLLASEFRLMRLGAGPAVSNPEAPSRLTRGRPGLDLTVLVFCCLAQDGRIGHVSGEAAGCRRG